MSKPCCLARLVSFCIVSAGICGTSANKSDVVVSSHNPGRIVQFSAELADDAASNNDIERRILRIESPQKGLVRSNDLGRNVIGGYYVKVFLWLDVQLDTVSLMFEPGKFRWFGGIVPDVFFRELMGRVPMLQQ